MDIKDYSKTKIHNSSKPKIEKDKLESVQNNYGDLVNEFMKRYGKMDEKQMMDEMFVLIKQKKSEGTFNIEQIRQIAQNVKPFLSVEQQNYMEELLEKIAN